MTANTNTIDDEVVEYRKIVRLECDQTWRCEPLNEHTMAEFRRLEESLSRRLTQPRAVARGDSVTAALGSTIWAAVSDHVNLEGEHTGINCYDEKYVDLFMAALEAAARGEGS